MSARGNGSRLGVELLNSKGQAIVFVSQTNTVRLRLTNQTGSAVWIQAGTPQNPPPPGGPFEILLDFSAFYAAPGGQRALQISAAGWTAAYLGGPFPSWSLAAVEGFTWADGAPLEFAVANLAPTVSAGAYDLNVSVYNLNGQPPLPIALVVSVANPPDGSKKELSQTAAIRLRSQMRAPSDAAAVAAADDAVVVITKNPSEPVSNRLILAFYNFDPDNELVKVNWGPEPPQFILSFDYASTPPGYFAVTTPADAARFAVGIEQGSGWKAPSRLPDGLHWLLAPENTNQRILGTGTENTVEFSIDHIVTQFAAGQTLLYFSYHNIPGYNDGVLSAVIDKAYAPMTIDRFEVSPTTFPVPGDQPATGFLDWQVENSVMVSLSGVGLVPSHQSAFRVSVEKNETLVLIAYDTILGAIRTASVDIQVDPPTPARWLPDGCILLWSGDLATIPPGFALCDGKNRTPDLRDRFVVGAEGQEANTSGVAQHTHEMSGLKGTATTSETPAHAHAGPTEWRSFWPGGFLPGLPSVRTPIREPYNPSNQVQDAGAHRHDLSVDFGSPATAVNTGDLRPKWYALCYIMKLWPK